MSITTSSAEKVSLTDKNAESYRVYAPEYEDNSGAYHQKLCDCLSYLIMFLTVVLSVVPSIAASLLYLIVQMTWKLCDKAICVVNKIKLRNC